MGKKTHLQWASFKQRFELVEVTTESWVCFGFLELFTADYVLIFFLQINSMHKSFSSYRVIRSKEYPNLSKYVFKCAEDSTTNVTILRATQ